MDMTTAWEQITKRDRLVYTDNGIVKKQIPILVRKKNGKIENVHSEQIEEKFNSTQKERIKLAYKNELPERIIPDYLRKRKCREEGKEEPYMTHFSGDYQVRLIIENTWN